MEQQRAQSEQQHHERTIQLPGVVDFTSGESRLEGVTLQGFAQAEPHGTWTDGREARISCAFAPTTHQALLLRFEIAAFLDEKLPKQNIAISIDGVPAGTWAIGEKGLHMRSLSLPLPRMAGGARIALGFTMPDAQSQ